MMINSDLGKVPPHAVDIEEILLGEVILFPETMDDIHPIISEDDFYKDSNRLIFRGLKDLWANKKKIDIFILGDCLKSMDSLDRVGGQFALIKLTEGVVHAHNIKDHALIIKDKSVKRKYISLAQSIFEKAYDERVDLEELVDTSNSSHNNIMEEIYRVSGGKDFMDYLRGVIDDYYERKERYKLNKISGVVTPVLDLTKITGGWQPSDLVVIAGRPSMGKTAFAVQAAVTASLNGEFVDFYTLEMSGNQLTQRIMSCVADINIEKLRNGSLSPEEEEMMEKSVNDLLKYKINIDDGSGITAEYIRAKSSVNHRKGRCDMIVVDYLQLMSYNDRLTRNDGIGSITRKLKGLAKELAVPVIILSQLSRATEAKGVSRRPALSHLRDSGEIEQDADLVIFPFRPHYYDDNEDDTLIELNVAKHRNGRTGMILARHNSTITRIFDDPTSFSERMTHGDAPF